MATLTAPAWIDAFVMELSKLGVRAEPQHIVEMATELHDTMGHLDPVEAAQAEWREWPPHDD